MDSESKGHLTLLTLLPSPSSQLAEEHVVVRQGGLSMESSQAASHSSAHNWTRLFGGFGIKPQICASLFHASQTSCTLDKELPAGPGAWIYKMKQTLQDLKLELIISQSFVSITSTSLCFCLQRRIRDRIVWASFQSGD